MGMPNIDLSFSEKAATVVKRGERGIVALILRDTVGIHKNAFEVLTTTDISEWITEDNKKQINLALMGYVKAPKKVLVYVIGEEDEYTAALKYLETTRFDYLAIPTVETDGKCAEVATWIKTQRANGKRCKAVLPNYTGDSEGIINYATEKAIEGDTEYTTEQYCSRIAGLIAGTPLTIACTYAPLTELTDCTRLNKKEMDAAIDAGQFIIWHDGEKVKVGRGVNSLTTTTEEKNSQHKKIKIIEATDLIYDDLVKVIQDSYIGKYANSYSNKCLLLSAIGTYFNTLIAEGILSSATIEIDIEANKRYLDSKGVDTSEMNDTELKQADTDDKVFLKATIKILDAIEDVSLPINI